YVLAGTHDVDLPLALEKIHARFGASPSSTSSDVGTTSSGFAIASNRTASESRGARDTQLPPLYTVRPPTPAPNSSGPTCIAANMKPPSPAKAPTIGIGMRTAAIKGSRTEKRT